jgi:hypothetical protein
MDWQRLGEEVERRRGQLGYGSRHAFAEATQFAEKTLGDVENARRETYSPVTLARLERALRWPPGTVDAILAGDSPPASRPDLPPFDPAIPVPQLVAELIRMLAPDSPLPDEERVWLLTTLDVILQRPRVYMTRGSSHRPPPPPAG